MGIIGLSWSGGWIGGKIALLSASPLAMSAVRSVIATAILIGLAIATGARVPWRRWPALIALGATGIFGYAALVFTGLRVAPVADGALIVPTFSPVIAAVLAVPFAGEPMLRSTVAGLAVSTLGVVLIVGGGGSAGDARLLGDALILGGAACWAVYTVLGKSVLREGSPLGVTAVASAVGMLMLLAAALAEGGLASIGAWPIEAWLAILFLAIFSTVLAFVLFYRLVIRVGAARAATTSYLVPVLTLVLAALLLGERVSAVQLSGGALTLVGMRVAAVSAGEGAWLRRFAGI